VVEAVLVEDWVEVGVGGSTEGKLVVVGM